MSDLRKTDIRLANVVHPMPDGFQLIFGEGRYLLTVRQNGPHGFHGSIVESLLEDAEEEAEPNEVGGIEFHGGPGPIEVHNMDGMQ